MEKLSNEKLKYDKSGLSSVRIGYNTTFLQEINAVFIENMVKGSIFEG